MGRKLKDSLLEVDTKELDSWIPCAQLNFDPGRMNLFYGQGRLRLMINLEPSLFYFQEEGEELILTQ